MNENQLQLQYANQTMQYTTQFIASMSGEEVILDCGSVVGSGAQAGQQQLPIHTRMALPWSAVSRLHRLLGEMIESHQSATQATQAAQPPRASLPPLTQGGAPSELATTPHVQTPL